MRARDLGARHRVSEPAQMEERIAELLVSDGVVARCAGRMEFGARALGNRSILANPADHRVVDVINRMIKNRDFWMPFAPSVLRERETDYIVNPKGLASPYMMLAFPTNPKRRDEIVAAVHPQDGTARAHIVDEAWNPGYHRVIREFERRTGTGAVLNTSFNLHGEPLVGSPADARRHLRALGAAAPGAWAIPDLQEVAADEEEDGMLSEFKTFIMRGNMVDLAVGIVIGRRVHDGGDLVRERPADAADRAAAGQGGLRQPLRHAGAAAPIRPIAAAKAAGVPTLNYGLFINNVINPGDRRLRGVPGREAGESPPRPGAAGDRRRASARPARARFPSARAGARTAPRRWRPRRPETSVAQLYDEIGGDYRAHRRPDPRVAAAIIRALGDAATVVNVGAGAGSYEPADRRVVAVEPSAAMIAQRPAGSAPGRAGLGDRRCRSATHAFAAALAVLTVHHWPDRARGLAELARVARERVVVLTWDPASVGLLAGRRVLPRARRASTGGSSRRWTSSGRALGTIEVRPLAGPARLHRRLPRRLLAATRGLSRPRRAGRDLDLHQAPRRRAGARPASRRPRDGHLAQRHADLLERAELDLGYRLVIASPRRAG